ncbi:hypothetical protein [Longimicrobium terrae]|uniref:Uncharacterized protein n=1 Tax=Longimicrobium terrae TaxID=1639882 RepID=A0A841GV18_9BACT|nr:hypothetical protein [Longimicrobium terrae]MBB4634077.1 hypothetical protein [Longimicrobium terrae]MBB6069033.1 hypothetical protein [Longimicrobium terrae]NNC28209.1 hypothetical protein [Longimicrobium terrae]
MIAWIVSSGRLPYVSAIFRDEAVAEQYLAALPPAIRERSSTASRSDLTLPCYLAEDSAGFRLMSETEARDYLAETARTTPDPEGVYGNLYRIDAELLPEVPGRDEMGRLPHIHLRADDLALAAEAGVAALWGDRTDYGAPGI